MIRREHDWAAYTLEVVEPADAHPRENAPERQDPRRLAEAPDDPNNSSAVPRRKLDRIRHLGLLRRRGHDRSQLVERSGTGEFRFVDAGLELVFQRYHQLDALQRAQTETFDRGAAVERSRSRELGEQ